MKSMKIVFGATVIVTFAAGSAAGFFTAKRQLEKKYAELAETEIAQAKAFYAKLHKKEEFETPEEAAEALLPKEAVEAIKVYQGRPSEGKISYNKVALDAEKPPESETKNVFQRPPETDFDWERRVRNRTEEAPYVITADEYFENETDYKQTTLSYYEGDGVLADERDDRIEEIDMTVGDDNIVRFGDHSNDPNIVYIRNDRLGIDFEITRSSGKYSVEVLGFEGT